MTDQAKGAATADPLEIARDILNNGAWSTSPIRLLAHAYLAKGDSARKEALEEAESAVREATKPMLTDRSAYVLSGPASIVSAALSAIRALKEKPHG